MIFQLNLRFTNLIVHVLVDPIFGDRWFETIEFETIVNYDIIYNLRVVSSNFKHMHRSTYLHGLTYP